jgi:predicted GIY-YIG superfamily endonuclease
VTMQNHAGTRCDTRHNFGTPRPRCNVMYRIYDLDGELFYVGLSNQFEQRVYAHVFTDKLPYAHVIRVEAFPDRDVAALSEAWAYQVERPSKNRMLLTGADRTCRPTHVAFFDLTGGILWGLSQEWLCLDGGSLVPAITPTWARPLGRKFRREGEFYIYAGEVT